MFRNKAKVALGLAALVVTCLGLGIVVKYSGLREAVLFRAAETGNNTLARILISLGTNVNFRDKATGGTALFYAAGHAHPKVIRTLLAAGANATIPDHSGQTALCCSLQTQSSDGVDADELLIDAGALTTTPNPFACIPGSRISALHIKVLLKHGANPNMADAEGATPLMIFAEGGDISAISTLLANGANINATARDGRTALSIAVEQANADAVEYLLAHGGDATAKVNGQSLVNIASAQREKDVKAGAKDGVARYSSVISILESHENSSSGELSAATSFR